MLAKDNLKPGEVSKGIRRVKKPKYIGVHIDSNTSKPSLVVVHRNGDTELLPVSKRIAEVLIARGMNCGN